MYIVWFFYISISAYHIVSIVLQLLILLGGLSCQHFSVHLAGLEPPPRWLATLAARRKHPACLTTALLVSPEAVPNCLLPQTMLQ